jgi:hypothetical protein
LFICWLQQCRVKIKSKKALKIEDVKLLSDYVSTYNWRKGSLKSQKYFYEVEFNKPGRMIMPILVEITYEDVQLKFQIAQIWRKNNELKGIYTTERKQSKNSNWP